MPETQILNCQSPITKSSHRLRRMVWKMLLLRIYYILFLMRQYKKKASHDLKVWQIPRYIINFMIKFQYRIPIRHILGEEMVLNILFRVIFFLEKLPSLKKDIIYLLKGISVTGFVQLYDTCNLVEWNTRSIFNGYLSRCQKILQSMLKPKIPQLGYSEVQDVKQRMAILDMVSQVGFLRNKS